MELRVCSLMASQWKGQLENKISYFERKTNPIIVWEDSKANIRTQERKESELQNILKWENILITSLNSKMHYCDGKIMWIDYKKLRKFTKLPVNPKELGN